jgi:hypothetical protein
MTSIINDYLENSSINVPTIITYTMLRQPEIVKIFNKINDIDITTLERKTTNFIGKDVLKDESDIILIVLLSTLMYKNDVFPQFIYEILNKLNVTSVSVQELKQNSENIINMLLNNSTGGGQKGGNFAAIVSVLFQIAWVLITIETNYYYVSRTIPVFQEAYKRGSDIYQVVKSVGNMGQECGNMVMPPEMRYIDKYFISQFYKGDLENVYKTITCIANKHANQYLQDEIFMPENINDFVVNFSEIVQQGEEVVSNALVPVDYKVASNALVPVDSKVVSNALVPVSPKVISNAVNVQMQITQLNTQLQPVKTNIENTMNELIIFDGPKIDFDKTNQTLIKYGEMSEEDLFYLFYPKTELVSKKSENSIFSVLGAYEFAKDTVGLFASMTKIAIDETGGVNAIYVTKQYIWIFKDYCIKKKRELEDIRTKTGRQVEDFIKEADRTKQNINDFFDVLPRLIMLNSGAGGIIILFICQLFFKTKGKKNLAIGNGTIATGNGTLAIKDNVPNEDRYENLLRGGKKIHKTRKTKKSYKTRKNKRKIYKITRKNKQNKNKNKKTINL